MLENLFRKFLFIYILLYRKFIHVFINMTLSHNIIYCIVIYLQRGYRQNLFRPRTHLPPFAF